MEIKRITENKKQYLDLLLLADEQESMIDKYIDHGDLFALYDDDLKSICVVTDEGGGVCELKSLATYPQYQGMGYATRLIEYIFDYKTIALSQHTPRYWSLLQRRAVWGKSEF